ncbi:hypothetical protein [Paraflavitalea speifideaquila]|uniref:hypothetical protein n=1 Tax=Paraflavitalea speifideaquila TaxID=3076558 RepID=UPI0028EA96D7|nr:hypothetical protein [Paraflavitalea speifideiaquila]
MGAAGRAKGTQAQLSANPGPLASAETSFQTTHQPSQAGNNKPKAILIDEQLNYVAASSGYLPVGDPNAVLPWPSQPSP